MHHKPLLLFHYHYSDANADNVSQLIEPQLLIGSLLQLSSVLIGWLRPSLWILQLACVRIYLCAGSLAKLPGYT